MKKVYSYLMIAASLLLSTACSDEWTDEQYDQFISIKAPVNSQGNTPIHIRYKENGKVTYQLPVIVSGSTMSEKDYDVRVSVDLDTLNQMNVARFSEREELYYLPLDEQRYSFPETVHISSGECVGLLNIDFDFSKKNGAELDLAEKWILPLTIADDPSSSYQPNMRKHYRKALLRIMPFNDFSGSYSTTSMKVYRYDDAENKTVGDPMVDNNRTAYVVNENAVFFYAGLMDEELVKRSIYKIKATFVPDPDDAEKMSGTVDLEAFDSRIDLKIPENATITYTRSVVKDAILPYIEHHFVTIRLEYLFSDITSVASTPIRYKVVGTMLLERKINTQIPSEEQAIEW